MRKKLTLSALILTSFVLLGASCSQKAPSSMDSSDDQKVAVSDTCGNPYYPFKKGLSIAYQVTPAAGAPGSSDYTITTIDVIGTKAKIRAELVGGAIAEMEADCADGSVALNGASGLGAAIEGMQFKTTVVSSTGSSMPANVKAGSSWNHSETVKMEITGGQAGIAGSTMILTTKEESKAVGEESVTVPAGTYKAMKVEVTRKTSSEFTSGAGASLGKLPESTDVSTEWWVKGVGLIKEITKSSDGSTSTSEAKLIRGQ